MTLLASFPAQLQQAEMTRVCFVFLNNVRFRGVNAYTHIAGYNEAFYERDDPAMRFPTKRK